MQHVFFLGEVNEDNFDQIGIKSLNLAFLAHRGFNVPPGFIIGSHVYDALMNHDDIKEIMARITHPEDIENIEEARALIRRVRFPQDLLDEIIESYMSLSVENPDVNALLEDTETYVSVRTSFKANLQGTSLMNVKGVDKLVHAILECYAQSIGTGMSPAILIQQMVQSEKSGIARLNGDHIEIEAIFGLGMGLAAGISPDIYKIDRFKYIVRDSHMADKNYAFVRKHGITDKINLGRRSTNQVLNDQEIAEVARHLNKVNTVFKNRMTLSWSMVNDRLFILQAKGETVQKDETPISADGDVDISMLEKIEEMESQSDVYIEASDVEDVLEEEARGDDVSGQTDAPISTIAQDSASDMEEIEEVVLPSDHDVEDIEEDSLSEMEDVLVEGGAESASPENIEEDLISEIEDNEEDEDTDLISDIEEDSLSDMDIEEDSLSDMDIEEDSLSDMDMEEDLGDNEEDIEDESLSDPDIEENLDPGMEDIFEGQAGQSSPQDVSDDVQIIDIEDSEEDLSEDMDETIESDQPEYTVFGMTYGETEDSDDSASEIPENKEKLPEDASVPEDSIFASYKFRQQEPKEGNLEDIARMNAGNVVVYCFYALKHKGMYEGEVSAAAKKIKQAAERFMQDMEYPDPDIVALALKNL